MTLALVLKVTWMEHGSAAARIRELRHAVMQRDEEIACLQEELQTLKVPSTFNYQAKCYEDNVPQCCYDLLSSNVSIGNVSSVIRSVAKNMFDCELDRLPGTSLLADMAVEMKQLAQMRAAEAGHYNYITYRRHNKAWQEIYWPPSDYRRSIVLPWHFRDGHWFGAADSGHNEGAVG